MADLFDSLEVQWLRGGTHAGVVRDQWTSYPHAVIGQVAGGAGRLEREGRRPALIRDGFGYVIPAGDRIRMIQLVSSPCRWRWMHVSLRILGTVELLSLLDLGPELEQGARVGDCAEALADTPAIADPLRRAAERKRLGFELLSLLLAQARPAAGSAARLGAIARLAPALERMERALAQALGRTELARLVGLSPTRFHAVFARALGCAPMAYLQRLRLRRAQHLLIAGDRPIGEIATAVGIPDQFHFSRLFRRRIGESPSAYRLAGRAALSGLVARGPDP